MKFPVDLATIKTPAHHFLYTICKKYKHIDRLTINKTRSAHRSAVNQKRIFCIHNHERLISFYLPLIGGPLAVTDANLCLGRLLPEFFPKIFGETEDQPLDRAATMKAFTKLTTEASRFDTIHIGIYLSMKWCP